MYTIKNNITYINGNKGIYDNKIKNDSVRYGRNASNNYKQYTEDIEGGKFPPLDFEYRYSPKKNTSIDKMALMGNAYEELGRNIKVKTEVLNEKVQKKRGKNYNINALDLNRDGNIDIGEYAASTLVQDAFSSIDGYRPNLKAIDGIINDFGMNAGICLYYKNSYNTAHKIFNNLYEDFDLEEAKTKFLEDVNNLE